MSESRQSGIAKLTSIFSSAPLGADANQWVGLGRSLAAQLQAPSLDWRDLARALEAARNNVTDPAISGMFDRAALYAMRLADPAEVSRASAEMLDACAPGIEPEQMLRMIAPILQRQIPFDLVSFVEYYHGADAASGTTLVRGRFAMDGGAEFRWPARWVEISEKLARWAEGDIRWIANSEDFYSEHPEANALRDNLVTKEYEKREATSYLIAPLLDGGSVKAVLTLARKRNSPHGAFRETDQYKLDALGMERILRRVLDAYDMRKQTIAKDIVALFTPDADPATLAKQLVTKLCQGFEWEYVGLFRINRARGKFEVAAEYDAHGQLAFVPGPDGEQDLSKGMLGQTLEAEHPLYVPDVTKGADIYNYIRASETHASALTFPIKIGPNAGAQIEWILDLESSQFHAFPYPEQEILKRTVDEVERAVALWFEGRLATVLLNIVEQGVVVLGNGTQIERANEAAKALLGLPKDFDFLAKEETASPERQKTLEALADLKSYAADESTSNVIAGHQVSGVGIHLRLRGADDVVRSALAVASYQDEAFHRRVLLLADVQQAEWVGALTYMETAVRAVAAQAHGRLLLAGSLLRNAQNKLPQDSPVRDLVERATRNLTSADLPYERIASVFDAVSAPKKRDAYFDLAGDLMRFKASLPKDDADGLAFEFDDRIGVIVRGDPERLSFAFRSLIGHLLAVRENDAPLKVSIEVPRGKAFVNIVLTAREPSSVVAALDEAPVEAQEGPHDQIARIESLAFAVATHAVEAVRKVIKEHRGRLIVKELSGEVLVSIGGLPVMSSNNSAKTAPKAPVGSMQVKT